jgi:large subunit ribosomal protein L23
MSPFTRYPLFGRGNPQLRVFLPNFWMKLVQREHEKLPSNKVNFIVSSEMTRLDVKNYLEKIYKVPVMDVRTVHVMGKIQKHKYLDETIKEDDHKLAFVTLVS